MLHNNNEDDDKDQQCGGPGKKEAETALQLPAPAALTEGAKELKENGEKKEKEEERKKEIHKVAFLFSPVADAEQTQCQRKRERPNQTKPVIRRR